ncbi:MAG: hypothetical protein ABH817_01750 [archaeon]
MYKPKEIIYLVVASLVLGFFLSLNLTWPILSFEPINFLAMSGLSLLMFVIFTFSQKAVAYSLDCNTEIKPLQFYRYWLEDRFRLSWPFPIWLVLPIITFLISSGKFIWSAIINFDIEPRRARIRRKYGELTEFDISKIAAAGSLGVLLFGVIMRIAGFIPYANLCILLGLLSLIPIGNGLKVFMGSRILWVFLFILTACVLLLINLQYWFAAILISSLVAVITVVVYYYFYER